MNICLPKIIKIGQRLNK